MTKPIEREIIRSLAYNIPVEHIAEAMGAIAEEISAIAETRKTEIIEERVFCQSKGEF